MSSLQEQVLAYFMANSMGAPFLFAPDVWSYGESNNEPADLMWVCEDTAVLINMTSSRKSFDKNLEHNMRQFKRALGLWKQNKTISGKNTSQEFKIKYDNIKHLVLISVSSGNTPALVCKHEITGIQKHHPNKTFLCVSLHEESLVLLSRLGASITDLISFVLLITHEQRPIDLKEMNAFIVDVYNVFAESMPEDLRKDVNRIRNTLLNYRAKLEAEYCKIYSDLDWKAVFTLCLRSAQGAKQIRDNQHTKKNLWGVIATEQIGYSEFVIGVIDFTNPGIQMGQFMDMVLSEVKRLETDDPSSPVIMFLVLLLPWGLQVISSPSRNKGITLRKELLELYSLRFNIQPA